MGNRPGENSFGPLHQAEVVKASKTHNNHREQDCLSLLCGPRSNGIQLDHEGSLEGITHWHSAYSAAILCMCNLLNLLQALSNLCPSICQQFHAKTAALRQRLLDHILPYCNNLELLVTMMATAFLGWIEISG